MSVEPDAAQEIVAELRAFWQFLKRTRSLEKANTILDLLTDEDADRLEAELADPENFGMAKSIFTAGANAGFDMTDEADVKVVLEYAQTGRVADLSALSARGDIMLQKIAVAISASENS